ncbi:beta-glucan synthesis-associated [Amanita rubescens]|nr:beta-glucan synthesis-associated [Amanita rubescens]
MTDPLEDDAIRSGTSTPHEFSGLLSHSLSDNQLTSRTTRFSSPLNPMSPRRLSSHGSMILYRLAEDKTALLPPRFASARNSLISTSGDSYVSFRSDSKYPSTVLKGSHQGLVPYEYDPTHDQLDPPDDEDQLHDPRSDVYLKADANAMPWRGILNVGLLILIILGLLTLFIFYPVYTWYTQLSKPITVTTPATPTSAKKRTGFDGQEYDLVFSDEFNTPGRTFYPGDDAYWEAVNLWYWRDGRSRMVRPLVKSPHATVTSSSPWTLPTPSKPTSPPTPPPPLPAADNHALTYRSGMLQSWNKFCFSSGYIEVSASFPGPDQNTQGYWPGAWTMGNLARPGYPATTSGLWPYTYDSAKYNYALSWLPGQRLSACSCPNSDHPGPSHSTGRGAPEIDIFEVEKDKVNPTGQVASQSAQFAPFTHDYVYANDTQDEFVIYNTSEARPNTYRGSAVQQAVSSLATVPGDMFQGSGAVFHTMGFEYWADPSDRPNNFITWQVDGSPSYRLGASAVGPDTGTNGTGVGQRLIPEEPMSIVLNLGISPNWQTIDLTTMIFPAELRIDYVRVYQRKGSKNVGCDPAGISDDGVY